MVELTPTAWSDYELLDSGNFEKLERFGNVVMSRPEPKALWQPTMERAQWDRMSHTRFVPGAGFGKAGKEDSGTWEMLKKIPERWSIQYAKGGLNFTLRLGLTSFKHVGVFPEQAPNWDYIFSTVKIIGKKLQEAGEDRRPKVLNLFAYTGGASLASCAAGAEVTHVDAVKQVVTWANDNMQLSGFSGIRWILEDAFKFVKRQVRRGALFDMIILDPPAYGHGPEGERWKLDESLFSLLFECNKILAQKNGCLVLNLYSNGYSALLANTVVRSAFGPSGTTEYGEMFLKDKFNKSLPLSVVVRLER